MSDGGGAFTVKEFCEAHRISVPFYYTLKSQGQGPRELRLNSKVLISFEAAAEWRRQHEGAESAPAAGENVDDVAPASVNKID